MRLPLNVVTSSFIMLKVNGQRPLSGNKIMLLEIEVINY